MADFIYRVDPWIKTLVLHNWPIMVLSVLISAAAGWAYLRPSRGSVLALYGLLLMALAFEYNKHGINTIRATTDYLFEIQPGLRYLVQTLLIDVLPLATCVAGLLFLCLSFWFTLRKPGIS